MPFFPMHVWLLIPVWVANMLTWHLRSLLQTRKAPQTPIADVDSKQTAAQLKEQLAALGLSRAGRKADLLQRLQVRKKP